MDQGRAATKAGRYDDAIAAFDRAVRARPVDARARAERGFAYVKRGSARTAVLDFDDARSLTREQELLSQIYFNLADAAANLGEPEAERLALALASRSGSKAARLRLGERSTCPAVWRTRVGDAGPIARSFLELVEKRPLVGCDYHREKVKTEAQARQYVCRGCAPRGEDGGDQCDGAGPWTIDSGYMHFQAFQFFVAPLPGKYFFYSTSASTPYRVEGSHLLVTEFRSTDLPLIPKDRGEFIDGRFSNSSGTKIEIDNNGRWSDESDDGSICDLEVKGVDLGDFRGTPTMPTALPVQTTAYSLATKHERFTLAVYDGAVSLTIDADRARLRGESCDGEIALPSEP